MPFRIPNSCSPSQEISDTYEYGNDPSSFAKDGEFSKQHGFSGMTPFPGVCKLRSTETRGNFFM